LGLSFEDIDKVSKTLLKGVESQWTKQGWVNYEAY
jgi:hypothetical protein